MNQITISKSKLKPRLLEILREVERSRKELVITDHGKPVLKILPYSPKPSEILKTLPHRSHSEAGHFHFVN